MVRLGFFKNYGDDCAENQKKNCDEPYPHNRDKEVILGSPAPPVEMVCGTKSPRAVLRIVNIA